MAFFVFLDLISWMILILIWMFQRHANANALNECQYC